MKQQKSEAWVQLLTKHNTTTWLREHAVTLRNSLKCDMNVITSTIADVEELTRHITKRVTRTRSLTSQVREIYAKALDDLNIALWQISLELDALNAAIDKYNPNNAKDL